MVSFLSYQQEKEFGCRLQCSILHTAPSHDNNMPSTASTDLIKEHNNNNNEELCMSGNESIGSRSYESSSASSLSLLHSEIHSDDKNARLT